MRAKRCGLVLALIGAALAVPARGDEVMERRFLALRALLEPAPRPPVAGRRAREADASSVEVGRHACLRSPVWRESRTALRLRTEAAIHDAALRFAVDPPLIRSVIRAESGYDPEARSRAGAMGLMQLMPATARALGVRCPYDPRENVLAGTRYLRRLYDRFGSWPRAVAAYNAGPTRIEAGIFPEETRHYVGRVLRNWRPRRWDPALRP